MVKVNAALHGGVEPAPRHTGGEMSTEWSNSLPFKGQSPVRWYVTQWALSFALSIVGCVIACTLYGIPLEQVANVLLSINYTYLLAGIFLYLLLFVLFVLTRQMEAIGMAVMLIMGNCLLFFAPTLAFQFYAAVTHADIHDSWVYGKFDAVIQHTAAAFFVWIGSAVGSKIGPVGGLLVQMGSRASGLLGFVSALVTLFGFLRSRGGGARPATRV